MNTLVKKDQNHYQTLVEAFMKDANLLDVDPMEKKKFMAICVVNKLNPFKWQIYAIPRNKKIKEWNTEKWIKVLTPVINYNVFLERAEESGKLSWWNILLKKEKWEIVWGKITIYRKDWNHPFEYEADVKDFLVYKSEWVLENPLWNTKTEAMMRKQLIRVWFGLCFPENCASLNVEEIEPEQIISGDIDEPKALEEDPEIPEVSEPMETPSTTPITNDQIKIIRELSVYLPEEVESPDEFSKAEEMIHQLKVEIGKKFIKDETLVLTKEEIERIFAGVNKELQAIKKAALKKLDEISKEK
jgi:hypothetical protein